MLLFPYVSKYVRTINNHGFLHTSIVNSILINGIPPQDPLFYGTTIKYPYMFHLFSATLSHFSNFSIFWIFFLINTLSLVIIMNLTYFASRKIKKNTLFNALSVFIVITGFLPIYKIISELIEYSIIRDAATSFLIKFGGINQEPLALTFFILFVYSTIHYSIDEKRTSTILMFISLLGTCYFYPIFSPPLFTITLMIFLHKYIKTKEKTNKNKIIKTATILFTSLTLLSLPYAINLLSGKGGHNTLTISGLTQIIPKITTSLLLIPYLLLTLFYFWKNKKNTVKKVKPLFYMGLLISFLFFLLASLNQDYYNEYKFIHLFLVFIGISSVLGFEKLIKKTNNKKIRQVILILIILIFSYYAIEESIERYKTAENKKTGYDFIEIKNELQYLPVESDQSKLFEWIQTTDKNSVFIDSDSLIPIFGKRRQFINTLTRDGFLKSKKSYKKWLVQILDYDQKDVLSKIQIKNDILYGKNETEQIIAMNYLKTLEEDIYVVIRDRKISPNISSHFDEVFITETIKVYKLKKETHIKTEGKVIAK